MEACLRLRIGFKSKLASPLDGFRVLEDFQSQYISKLNVSWSQQWIVIALKVNVAIKQKLMRILMIIGLFIIS